MNTEEFLRLVLPSQGVYYGVTPREEGGFNHRAFTDINALAAYCKRQSAAGDNVYFACAAFSEEKYFDDAKQKYRKRTQDNARAAKCQWIDIDCGADKTYKNQREGLIALAKFCKATSLPAPNLLVNSGNGVHAYWMFDREVDKVVWNKSSAIFKSIMQRFEFAQDDTTRTADIASVLRPINTNNDKSHKGLGITPVQLMGKPNLEPTSYPKWVKQLVTLVSQHGVELPRTPVARESRNNDLIGGQEFPPSYAERIAERCQQVMVFRDLRGASQEEPLWRACLGVMAFCEDGLDKGQEWSAGHDDYSEVKTFEKMNAWKASAGPATCNTFKNANAEGCKGCKYAGKIVSPITLGFPEPEHRTEQVVEQVVVNDEGEKEIQEVVERTPEFPEHVAKNYRWTGRELCVRKPDPDGVVSWIPMCAQLPIPEYVYFDGEADCWKLHLKVWVRPFVWREADINHKAVAQGGTALLGELGNNAGVVPKGNGVDLVNYMRTWAENIQMASDEVSMHEHYGWQNDKSFLLGASKYLPDGSVQTVRLAESIESMAADHVPTGDLARYKELINEAYNRQNHEVYQFTWLSAFASPMLAVAHAGPIGIPVVGWSKESGLGKSTAAIAGIGVWGNPNGANQTANADKVTDYGLYVMAGLRRNLPVLLDETTMKEAKWLAQMAYDYSDGRPKIQGKASGGLRDNSNIQWSNVMYVTSNKSVTETMANTIVDCGPQISRVWEYQYRTGHADTMSREHGEQLFQELWGHYALAGDQFLRFLVPNREAVAQLIFKVRDEFAVATKMDKSARFWLLGAACVWVSFLITKKLGLQKFDGSALKAWIISHLQQMHVVVKSSQYDMLDMFADMMSDMQNGFIVTYNEGDARRGTNANYASGFGPPRSQVVGRVLTQDRKVYLSSAAVKTWCVEKGISYREMEQALLAKGWFLRTSKYSLGRGTDVALGQVRCMVLDWGSYATHITPVRDTEEEAA